MIFHIYGTDAYLCQEKLKELKQGCVEKKDKAGLNVIRLTAEGLDIDRFSQEALTVPFLSEKKMIVVEGLYSDMSASRKKLREEILKFLKEHENMDNNILFFDIFDEEKKIPEKDALFNYLKKQQYSWFLPALKNRQLADWLKKYVSKNNIDLSAQALNELIILVGNDLVQLTNELKKLSAFKDGKQILPEDVKLLVKAKYDDNVFNLTDALANKNRQRALELVSQQLAGGNEPLSLLGSINWQFKSLLKIKSILEANPKASAAAISTQTGLHSYVVSKNLATIKKFSLSELIDILNHLLEIEKKLKSGHKNPELLFDLFIARHC
jgi:DNA polymerase-3 subunit delta